MYTYKHKATASIHVHNNNNDPISLQAIVQDTNTHKIIYFQGAIQFNPNKI